MTNPLTLPSDEAAEVIRRRQAKRMAEERVASRRRRDAARSVVGDITTDDWLPGRAFQALILFYEKVDQIDMADLLRLDLDRFSRNAELREQLKWGKKKEKAG